MYKLMFKQKIVHLTDFISNKFIIYCNDHLISKILILLFIIYSIILLYFSVYAVKPIVTGDAHEYLGMTVSFYNHFSPDLTNTDITMRNIIENKNNINFNYNYNYYGYFKSLNNQYFSWHFWLYSLINLPIFSLLHIFNFNELRSFQITNSILLLFSLLILLVYAPLTNMKKLYLFLLSALNPIIFYIIWPHPEIFIYSLVLVSFIFMLAKKYSLSIIFSSLASLQSPPIAIITLFLIIYSWREKLYAQKYLLKFIALSSISIIPYIFYYINYHAFNLIVLEGYSNFKYMSFDKIVSLFIDFNFGILPYFPILFILCIFSLFIAIIKKDIIIPALWTALLLMAIICSTELNWNSGMMYINRYLVFFIPILFVIIILSYNYYPSKIFSLLIILSILITILITFSLCSNYDLGNYIKFNYLSKEVLIHAPYLYNPQYEVFAERTLNTEIDPNNYTMYLPIIYMDKNHPYKILTDYYHINEVEKDLNITIQKPDIDRIKKSRIGYINI